MGNLFQPAVVTLAPGIRGRVLAWQQVQVPLAQIPGLRPSIQAFCGDRVSVGLLKHADELTLVSLTAIQQAMTRANLTLDAQVGWGIVTNPGKPGRTRMMDSLTKYPITGAWSVTPHFVPHCMVHSISGMLSQALGLHGPNMGIGIDPGTHEQLCLSAAAWFGGKDTHGAWLILARWLQDRMDSPDCLAHATAIAIEHTTDAADVTSASGWPALATLMGEQP